ncbi:MAG: cation transporter [Spirochaetota bacterium]
MKMKRYLHLKGATCASCAYTIEKVGRKMDGVEDIRVNSGLSQVEVTVSQPDEEKQTEILENIRSVVRKIGYDADIAD